MGYFIAEDGKTFHTTELTRTGIRLDTGRELPDGTFESRIFATNPLDNPRLHRVGAVWHYDGHCMADGPCPICLGVPACTAETVCPRCGC